jgi:hypothetical protein
MMSTSALRAGRYAFTATLAAGVLFTGVVGFAHTAPGRPLLGVIGPLLGMSGGGRCPLGYDVKATPAQRQAQRRQFATTHPGSTKARERPAMGFVLDETTRGDVAAWATQHGVTCVVPKSGPDLRCENVPRASLPDHEQGIALHSLWFTFGAGDTLIAAVGIRNDKSELVIGQAFSRVTHTVEEAAGPATKADGDPSALASGTLYQASAEYRFQDYFVVARATNMGSQGFMLSEEYRSL